ncbi:MAG TPA: M48 family metalloprotease, partial [Methylomirabilota bacterium]|nr:M48 family metalloprotease [Methylomirabilota bacterium]
MSRRLSGFLALLLSLAVVGCQTTGGSVAVGMLTGTNPEDIRGATTEIDEPEEIELGRAVTASLGSRYTLSHDEDLTRYVALVGNAVALQSDRPDIRYYFGVLDTEEVNAFAAPGGYVFITRGTLRLMRDESTLAAVLGHEIGHVALKHHVNEIKKQKERAVEAGTFKNLARIGSGFIPGVGGAVTSTVVNTPVLDLAMDGVVNLSLKGYSRDQEEEADRVGFAYASRAGYDPGGLRDFLKAVQDSGSQPAKSGFFTNLNATHPGAADRLKEQEAQLKSAPAGGRRAAPRFEQQVIA